MVNLCIKLNYLFLLSIDTAVEEESRARADIEDQAGIAERKGENFIFDCKQ